MSCPCLPWLPSCLRPAPSPVQAQLQEKGPPPDCGISASWQLLTHVDALPAVGVDIYLQVVVGARDVAGTVAHAGYICRA
jgi:hypothetical protein